MPRSLGRVSLPPTAREDAVRHHKSQRVKAPAKPCHLARDLVHPPRTGTFCIAVSKSSSLLALRFEATVTTRVDPEIRARVSSITRLQSMSRRIRSTTLLRLSEPRLSSMSHRLDLFPGCLQLGTLISHPQKNRLISASGHSVRTAVSRSTTSTIAPTLSILRTPTYYHGKSRFVTPNDGGEETLVCWLPISGFARPGHCPCSAPVEYRR